MYPKLILAFTFLAAAAALFTYRQTSHAPHATITGMVRMPTAGAQAEDLLLAERIQMLARRKR